MRNAQGLQYKELPKQWRTVSSVRGIRDVALVWSGILATVALVSANWHPLLWVGSLLLLGGLQNHLNSLMHHSFHGNIHPNRAVNDWIARVFLTAPIGQCYSAVRQEHLDHHRDLGAADDPERFYYDLKRHGRATASGFAIWLAGIFMGWVLIPMIARWASGARDRRAGSEYLYRADKNQSSRREKLFDLATMPPVHTILLVVFWGVTGVWWGYFAFWMLPLVTFGAGLVVLRATIEHANPHEHATANDPHDIMFSFESNPLERFFVAPLQFNYHYEHHRFMAVPYYHTPKLRQALIENDDFRHVTLVRSYARRVVEICRMLRGRSRAVAGA